MKSKKELQSTKKPIFVQFRMNLMLALPIDHGSDSDYGRSLFSGKGLLIMSGVHICEDTILEAYSLVVRDVPK